MRERHIFILGLALVLAWACTTNIKSSFYNEVESLGRPIAQTDSLPLGTYSLDTDLDSKALFEALSSECKTRISQEAPTYTKLARMHWYQGNAISPFETKQVNNTRSKDKEFEKGSLEAPATDIRCDLEAPSHSYELKERFSKGEFRTLLNETPVTSIRIERNAAGRGKCGDKIHDSLNIQEVTIVSKKLLSPLRKDNCSPVTVFYYRTAKADGKLAEFKYQEILGQSSEAFPEDLPLSKSAANSN